MSWILNQFNKVFEDYAPWGVLVVIAYYTRTILLQYVKGNRKARTNMGKLVITMSCIVIFSSSCFIILPQ